MPNYIEKVLANAKPKSTSRKDPDKPTAAEVWKGNAIAAIADPDAGFSAKADGAAWAVKLFLKEVEKLAVLYGLYWAAETTGETPEFARVAAKQKATAVRGAIDFDGATVEIPAETAGIVQPFLDWIAEGAPRDRLPGLPVEQAVVAKPKSKKA